MSNLYTIRRNDLRVLRECNFIENLNECYNIHNIPEENRYKFYGDSAFRNIDSNLICTGYTNPTPEEAHHNAGLNSVREEIEHLFKDLGQYWSLTTNKNKLKILRSFQEVEELVHLCFGFTNFLNIFNYLQTAQTLECHPPTFEQYIAGGPRGNHN